MKAKMYWLIICQFLLVVYHAGAQQAAQLTLPAQDASLDITNNILFKWNAAQITDAVEISYKIQVFEIGNSPLTQVKGSPVTFMNTQTPVWQVVQKKGLAASWPVPENAVGKKYLWRVITLVGGQPRSFATEMANYFYINSLTIKTDEVNKVITAEKKEVTFEKNNPPGRPKFPPQQKDTSAPVKTKQVSTNYTRPQLHFPNNGATIKATAIKNLQFSWYPVAPNPQQLVSYNWSVYEMQGGRSVNDIVKNSNPIMQGSVKGVVDATINLPADAPGKSYAWTVRAVNGDGAAYGDNNGYADPFVFSVQSGGKEAGQREHIISLIEPANGTIISAADARKPTGYVFSVNAVPTAQEGLRYIQKIWEVPAGITAIEVIKGGQKPIFEKMCPPLCCVGYPVTLPPNSEGKNFVWTIVEVSNSQGKWQEVKQGKLLFNEFSVAKGGKEPGPKEPGSSKNKYTGPKLKYPNNAAVLKAGAINNLQLSWEPVSPTPKQPLTYRWFVYEMLGDRTVTDIVKNSSPVKQGTVKNTFFATFNLPADAPGKTYAWTVQAVNDEGGSYGDNDGFADPFVFSVQGGKVTGPKDPGQGTQRANCFFDPSLQTISCMGKTNKGETRYVLKIIMDNTKPTPSDLYFNDPYNFWIRPNGSTIGSSSDLIKALDASQNIIPAIKINPIIPIIYDNMILAANSSVYEVEMLVPAGTTAPSFLNIYTSYKVGGNKNNCDDTIHLNILPPCPCDFCDDLKANQFTQAEFTYSDDNNSLQLNQMLNLPSKFKIKQLKAEIITFDWQTDNPECRKCQKDDNQFGVIIDGTLNRGNTILDGTYPDGIPNSHELDFNCLPVDGVVLNNGASVNLNISLPLQTTLSCCQDKFTFCIRYTIVTTDCKTCSIVKCYTQVPPRQHKMIINNGGGSGN